MTLSLGFGAGWASRRQLSCVEVTACAGPGRQRASWHARHAAPLHLHQLSAMPSVSLRKPYCNVNSACMCRKRVL